MTTATRVRAASMAHPTAFLVRTRPPSSRQAAKELGLSRASIERVSEAVEALLRKTSTSGRYGQRPAAPAKKK